MPPQIDACAIAHPSDDIANPWYAREHQDARAHWEGLVSAKLLLIRRSADDSPMKGVRRPNDDQAAGLQQRIDNANAYFRRKAAEVCTDEVALRLLAVLYQDRVIDLADCDAGQQGVPLAKLTAANFCEVGTKVIYITESGQRFVESIQRL